MLRLVNKVVRVCEKTTSVVSRSDDDSTLIDRMEQKVDVPENDKMKTLR